MTEETCRCGHPRAAHYTYLRAGKATTRCRACDPMDPAAGPIPTVPADMRPGAGAEDTYVVRMMQVADHAFEPMPADVEAE